MKQFRGKVAAITGAGSGIGRGLAVELAGKGCHLALSDVDDAGLAETVAMVEQAAGARGSVKVSGTHVDVTDRDAVEKWATAIADEFGQVNLIFNNAGVALSADVNAMSYESFTDWTALRLIDKDGVLLEELPPIQRFLNRVLALPIHMQNALFAEFMRRIADQTERARAAGTLAS